jgi:hypothetical protein
MTGRIGKYVSFACLSILLSSPAWAQQKTEYMYLPPEWAKNVVFYHSFEKGLDQPEINQINARVEGEKANIMANGITTHCYKSANASGAGKKLKALQVIGPGVAVNHSMTAMCWFRLDEQPKADSCYELLQLLGKDGWIASFVRGKGDWCNLSGPTRITQVHNFPGIANCNNPWGGAVTFKKGDWHHVAISVANASTVCVYWDGQLKETVPAKGRDFKADDVMLIQADSNPFYFPTSVDELIVANVALTGQQIADYIKAVHALTSMRFPAEVAVSTPQPAMPAK